MRLHSNGHNVGRFRLDATFFEFFGIQRTAYTYSTVSESLTTVQCTKPNSFQQS